MENEAKVYLVWNGQYAEDGLHSIHRTRESALTVALEILRVRSTWVRRPESEDDFVEEFELQG